MFKINQSCIEESYFLRKKKIPFANIQNVEVREVFSLVDEVGIIIYSDTEKPLTIVDSDSDFRNFVSLFRLEEILGDDWHQKAEEGNNFTISKEKISEILKEA